ncbi:MAG: hypothetical protein J7L34_00730, partial [Thermotogaceae bacterium]|nr:hypothetical protein [Thermotogaceae bacterium]
FLPIGNYFKSLFRALGFINKMGITREEAEAKVMKIYNAMPRQTRRKMYRTLEKQIKRRKG